MSNIDNDRKALEIGYQTLASFQDKPVDVVKQDFLVQATLEQSKSIRAQFDFILKNLPKDNAFNRCVHAMCPWYN